MTASPLLLVLSRGASSERAQRHLLPGALGALEQEAHEAFLAATLAAGSEAGCRLAVSCPTPVTGSGDVAWLPQSDGDFGTRLEAAVAEAFRFGAGSALLVAASDVPGLSSAHLEDALGWLSEDPERVVLGPSPDGGMYLVAFSRPIPGLATAARWRRRDTLSSLVRTLTALGRPVLLLSPLCDLDRPTDLDRWLAGCSTARAASEIWWALVGALRRALAARLRPECPADVGRVRVCRGAVCSGRAPPLLPFPA